MLIPQYVTASLISWSSFISAFCTSNKPLNPKNWIYLRPLAFGEGQPTSVIYKSGLRYIHVNVLHSFIYAFCDLLLPNLRNAVYYPTPNC